MSNTRKNRKAAGKCILCGVSSPKSGKQSCETCLEIESAKAIKRFEIRRESGLCPYCSGTPPSGQISCTRCCERKLKHQRKRVADGKCRKCNNLAEPGYTSCAPHIERSKQSHKLRDLEVRNIIRYHYGSECKCCGESIELLLTIDHIDGGGNKHRKLTTGGQGGVSFYRWLIKNNFPSGYQRMCFSCNNGKSLNGGICPHQTKMVVSGSVQVSEAARELHHVQSESSF